MNYPNTGIYRSIESRARFISVAALCILWAVPVLQFWGAVFGPMRSDSFPSDLTAPSPAWFISGLLVCFLPYLFPKAYYSIWEGARGIRIYELMGIRIFKRFVANGDLMNRYVRRSDPHFRVVSAGRSAENFLLDSRVGERTHTIFFLIGLFTVIHAFRLDMLSFAISLTLANIIFNLYPILLQRFNRYRIERIGNRFNLQYEQEISNRFHRTSLNG